MKNNLTKKENPEWIVKLLGLNKKEKEKFSSEDEINEKKEL